MTHRTPTRRLPAPPVPRLLALAAAAVLSGPAGAQTSAPAAEDAGTVVVTGQRASLVKAQDIKRNAEQVVDSIVADDIGKLPDANVAEALQRITGVQISRSRGEGDRVQVRGLQQTQTLLNGRVIFTAGKERGLSFQDVPSELLAGADIYKTPTADQVEGGIGGVIDLRTRRPFDFAGFKAAGTLKGTHADLAGKGNAEGSLLLSNRWKLDAGEFGALLSVSTQKRNYRADVQQLDPPAQVADNPAVFAPIGEWLAYELGSRERTGVSAALQFRPDGVSEYTLDLNRSQLKTRTDLYGFYGSPFWANWSNDDKQGKLWSKGPLTTDASGRFVQGTFWGASMSTTGAITNEDTTLGQLSLGGKWKLAPWTLRADLTHTSSRYDKLYNEVRLGSWFDASAFTYDLGTPLPSAGPTASALTDPGHAWADKALYYRIHNSGRDNALRVDAERGFDQGVVSRLRTGLRLSDRQASSAEINTINDISSAKVGDIPQLGVIPYNDLLSRAGSGSIPRQWLSVTDFSWLRNPAQELATFGLGVPATDPRQTFNFGERSVAAYGVLDLDSQLAGRPLTGNLGLRLVRTRTDRDYTVSDAGVSLPGSSRKTDTDVLPSLNLRWALSDKLQARLALSKVVTRPDFDKMTPSLSLNVNDHTAYQGNPELDKLSARQLDTSLEYYLSRSDHVYGAAFYKAVQGFLQTSASQRDFTVAGKTDTYTVSTQSNGQDGTIRGLELGYQGFFKDLPGLFSGLGLQANYTYVDSSAPNAINGQKGPLEGLSRQSYNLVGMYDLGGFSARLAYNYRGAYRDGAFVGYLSNDGKTTLVPVTMRGYGMVDAYVSFALSRTLKLALEANNLTRTVRHSQYGLNALQRGTYVDDRRVAVSLHVDL